MKYVLRACIAKNNYEKYIDELIEACQYANIDEIMMCEDNIFIGAIAQPLSAHREWANLMKDAVKRFRDKGIACSFYIKSLIGHFSCSSFALPFTKFVGANKEQSLSENCILDEDFADYAAELFSYYAECGFSSMMIDDDFRSVNHCNGQSGCFCEKHIQATSALFGQELTQDEVIYATMHEDERSKKIDACFKAANFRGQLDMVKKIEQAVHNVDEDIRLGLMCSGISSDEKQGRDMLLLIQTLAGKKHKPYLRPPGGMYFDTSGDVLTYGYMNGRQYRQYLKAEVDYISELDIYSPRNIFTKSVKTLDTQIRLHALSGYDKVSLNIIDHFTTPPMQFKEYFDLLRDNKEEYKEICQSVKNKVPYGIGVPVEKTATVNAHGFKSDFPSWTNYGLLLMRLGLPISYGETSVNILSRESILKYSNDELLRLLSKTLLLDHEAVRVLEERGFGKYLGVSYEKEIAEPCYEQFTNQNYHGECTGNYIPVKVCNVHKKETAWRMKCNEDAEVITRFVGADFSPISPAVVRYKNELGGTVVSFASEINNDNWLQKGRMNELHSLIYDSELALPFEIVKGVNILPIYYKNEKEEVLFLYNCSFDKQVVELLYNRKKQNITIDGLSLVCVE